MDPLSYQFPALRGVQAGRAYYVIMCPLRLVPRLFLFDEEELPPELRAQRVLNKARIPDISTYIAQNKDQYIFSSLTASIDGEIQFDPIDDTDGGRNIGNLVISMSSKLIINDGQHRRAAIEKALKEAPELGDETISIVFFLDQGLRRSQQQFADLNKHAVRPTKSLGILYDHRDGLARLARSLADSVPIFRGLIELEKTTISNRSAKLFTLSGLYQATSALFGSILDVTGPTDDQSSFACEYWTVVGESLPEWQLAAKREVSCAELRKEYVHAHGVVLHALGMVGEPMTVAGGAAWKACLHRLSEIDWRRSNRLWEGRAMIAGRMSKVRSNVVLTAATIKRQLGLRLTADEDRLDRLAGNSIPPASRAAS